MPGTAAAARSQAEGTYGSSNLQQKPPAKERCLQSLQGLGRSVQTPGSQRNRYCLMKWKPAASALSPAAHVAPQSAQHKVALGKQQLSGRTEGSTMQPGLPEHASNPCFSEVTAGEW